MIVEAIGGGENCVVYQIVLSVCIIVYVNRIACIYCAIGSIAILKLNNFNSLGHSNIQ